MQIFDVVVSIQMKSLKTDVEKGLTVKAICCQLVGPNREGKSLRSKTLCFCPRKGIRFIFRNHMEVWMIFTQVKLSVAVTQIAG